MDENKSARGLAFIATMLVVMVGMFLLAVVLSGCGGSDEPVCVSQCSPCDEPCRGNQ